MSPKILDTWASELSQPSHIKIYTRDNSRQKASDISWSWFSCRGVAGEWEYTERSSSGSKR